MKFCSHCGKEVNEKAVICPNCGCAIGNLPEEDHSNGGLVFLSILFPLLGIILAIVFWSKSKKAAKTYLKAALITIAVEIFFIIVIPLILVATVGAAIGGLFGGLYSGLSWLWWL